MSFLLAPHDDDGSGDEHDTLQAALAYLDNWTALGGGGGGDCDDIELDSLDDEEDEEATTGSGSDDSRSSQSLYPASEASDLLQRSSSSSSSSSDNSVVVQDTAVRSATQLHQRRGPKSRCLQLVRKPNVTRKRDPPPPRRNNKNEILELREEVIMLKARVTQLRSRGPDTNGRRQSTVNVSAARNARRLLLGTTGAQNDLDDDGAQLEFRRLHQSEALNRTLKAALAKQINLGKRLENLFKKQVATIVRHRYSVSDWDGSRVYRLD